MRKYILSILIISLLASCSDFQTLEQNPNLPTSVPSSIILRDVLGKMNGEAWNETMRNNQFYASNYNYYSNNEYNWGNTTLQFTTLKNVIKMEEEAKNSGAKDLNPYAALGKFLRAYYYTNMTLRVGDLPVKDALKGLEVDKPKYETQKEVFIQDIAHLTIKMHEEKKYSKIYLICPPTIMGIIRSSIDPYQKNRPLKEKLNIVEITKDLTSKTIEDIEKYISNY